MFFFQFVNDLEKDDKYKGWPSRAQDILRPTYPGMLRHVAKNFFNLVSIFIAESYHHHNQIFDLGAGAWASSTSLGPLSR